MRWHTAHVCVAYCAYGALALAKLPALRVAPGVNNVKCSGASALTWAYSPQRYTCMYKAENFSFRPHFSLRIKRNYAQTGLRTNRN